MSLRQAPIQVAGEDAAIDTAGGDSRARDSAGSGRSSRRMRPTASEVGIALMVGLASLIIIRWRSGWGALDAEAPMMYHGDMLQFGNMVLNAQLGNVFLGHPLGAPSGQQIGLSAYGVEWIQMWLTAHMAPSTNGPWLAIARYWQLTYLLSGVTAYLALRWIFISRFAAVLGAIAFTLIPIHEVTYDACDLATIQVLPLVLALAFRLVGGSSLAELVPSSWGLSTRWRRRAGLIVVVLCTLFAVTGGNYYMLFNLFILGSAAVVMMARRRWWRRARRLAVTAGCALVPLVLAYSPVVLGRLAAGLGLSEEATSDRRAFAAYANGGDPFALFLPYRGGFLMSTLRSVPVIDKFFREYDTAAITGEIYAVFIGGSVILTALIVVAIICVGGGRRVDLFRRISPTPALVKAAIAVGSLTVLWYGRGAFGTFLGFLLPQVRGYARAATLVAFCAVALLGLVATFRDYFGRAIRWLAIGFLCLAVIESISGSFRMPQVDPNAVGIDSPITPREVANPIVGFGINVTTPGPLGTKRLVAAAEQKLAPGCTVLVLPLTSFPVDFATGVVSYRSYDTLKPGLMNSDLGWTSGGFTGTPNNLFVDTWIAPYRQGGYAPMLAAADAAGYCGAVFFPSLHDSFYRAGPLNGSEYVKPASDVQGSLVAHYGRACYVEPEAGVELYCRK